MRLGKLWPNRRGVTSEMDPKTALKASKSGFRYPRRSGHRSPAVFSLRHGSALSPAAVWIALVNRVLPSDHLVLEPAPEARARRRLLDTPLSRNGGCR
jgi:hypothetical protein